MFEIFFPPPLPPTPCKILPQIEGDPFWDMESFPPWVKWFRHEPRHIQNKVTSRTKLEVYVISLKKTSGKML